MLRKKMILAVTVFGVMILSLSLYPIGAQEKADDAESCVKPAKGPIGSGELNSPRPTGGNPDQGSVPLAKVGKPAPNFEASAYLDGRFKNIQLSDYKGKWVVLCFYPGDFTFV